MKIAKHYLLAKDNPDHYVIHDSRDGKQFPVAKHLLDDSAHKQIGALPHFDQGTPDAPVGATSQDSLMTPVPTPVPDYSSANEPYSRWDALISSLPSAPNVSIGGSSPIPNSTPAQAAMDDSGMGGAPSVPTSPAISAPLESKKLSVPDQSQAPQQAPQNQSGVPGPQAPSFNSISAGGQFNAGLNQEISGIQGQAKEKSKEGDALAQAQYDAQGRMNQIQQDADAAKWKLDVEHETLSNEVANGKIDPNQYIHNMSAGNKILGAIAMAFGGAGAASAHQSNLAYDTVQKAIQQDIEAQKENLGTKKSLLSENVRRYGDLERATQATMMQMNAMTQGQIAAIAAKSGSSQAPFIAQQQIGQLKAANAGQAAQFAMQDATRKQLQNGQPMNAIDLVQAGVIPKEYQADAYKEQQSIEAQKAAIESTKNLFGKLDQEQSSGNILNPQSSKRVDALNTELVNTVMNASASKRLTRESIEAEIAPLKIKTSDDAETRATKQNSVMNLIQKHADATPLMQRYSPRSLPSYNSMGSPVERQTADGKTALFDSSTKKFLGYK